MAITPNTYKNGGVGVSKALTAICAIIKAFGPKLNAFIDGLVTSGHLSAADAATAKAFLSSATALCDIFKAIAEQQGA